MKAVIFNSGLGSRMGKLTSNKPKCMVELYNGETIFERQLRILGECGITEFVITTGPYREQLVKKASLYPEYKITWVDNPNYMNTNYIVSMNNAYAYLDEEILLLHGDLVFNRGLIKKLLADKRKSLCLFHETKELPKKDFKGRFKDGILKEVSVSVFGEDCYAFQPLYKLGREDIALWKKEVARFVQAGKTNVYAEEALNNITDGISIYGMSYRDDYIEEIDNEEDYVRVSEEIRFWDYREQHIEMNASFTDVLKRYVNTGEKMFAVCTKSQIKNLSVSMQDYDITIFSEYSPNPRYEEIQKGTELFRQGDYKTIISLGGGSAIDVAKCIKMHSTISESDFLNQKYIYNPVRHISIPTTAGTGSESTEIAVMYLKGEKKSVEHGSILPDVVILDDSLLSTLPDYQKKITMLDAFCQGIESYWSKGATKESKAYAAKCITLILENYKGYLHDSKGAVNNIMLAANYSGKAINISRTTSAHAMSYKLTSLYGIGHGHAVALCIMPIWRLLYHKSKRDESLYQTLQKLSLAMGFDRIEDSISQAEAMMQSLNLPPVKIKSDDIQMLANAVEPGRLSNNPVQFTLREIEDLYREMC